MTPLVFSLAQLAFGGTVAMDLDRWKGLLPPDDDPEEEAPAPAVWWRDLTLDPGEEEISFEASWRLKSSEEAWWEGTIAGPGVEIRSATLDGKKATLSSSERGTTVTGRIAGDVRLVVTGVVGGDASRGAVPIPLLGAAAGRVEVDTDQEPILTADAALVAMDGGAWSGAPVVRLEVHAKRELGPKPNLVIARSGLGVTVGDGALDVRGRVRWSVLQGSIETVSFAVSGAGSDLSVNGVQVEDWTRAGDQVRVTLREPADTAVDLDIHWTSAFGSEEAERVVSPALEPAGAFRTEYSLQLARDGEREVVPDLTGWSGIASSDLPTWGSGLVRGAPTASYSASSRPGGHLDLYQFTIVSGPPTFVDVAAYTIAATREGRTLIRAHYAIRNERGAFLRVVPPPNTTILGAQVSGETAKVATDGDGWLIPLAKSLETVDGLLSFPVEVILLGDDVDWARSERRALPLPTLDAPVAATQSTIYLPPGYQNRLDLGDSEVVDDFTAGEGIAYGSGFGDVGNAAADALFQSAVANYMGNRFEDVEKDLKKLEEMGASNKNIERLQSNMMVLDGESGDDDDEDTVQARRVRSQAQARSSSDRARQEKVVQQAEQDYLSGDYAAAEGNYKKALDIGKRLDKLEQSESKEEESRNRAFEQRLEAATAEKEKRKSEVRSREVDQPKDRIYETVIDGQFVGGGGSFVGGGEVGAASEFRTVGVGRGEVGAAGGVPDGVAGGVVGGVVGGVLGGAVAVEDGPVDVGGENLQVLAPQPDTSGDAAGGMEVLQAFAERHEGSSLGERALLGAFVAARAAGDSAQLYSVGEELLKRYGGSDQAASVAKSMGQAAASQFEFDRAIAYFEWAAAASPDPATGAAYLLAAEELRDQLAAHGAPEPPPAPMSKAPKPPRDAKPSADPVRVSGKIDFATSPGRGGGRGPRLPGFGRGKDMPTTDDSDFRSNPMPTDAERYRYGTSSLAEMRAALQTMAAGRTTTDLEKVQCKSAREASARALLEVAAASARQMQIGLESGDTQRADHEFRKISVAVTKTRSLLAEWQQCGAETSSGTTSVVLSIDMDEDEHVPFDGFGPLEDKRRSTDRVVLTRKTPKKAAKGKVSSAKKPEPAKADISVAIGGDEDKALEVTAAQLSVIVPTQGERVRYQHLLLPAGGELALHIDARRKER